MLRWTAPENGKSEKGGDCMFQLRGREKIHEPAFYVDTRTHLHSRHGTMVLVINSMTCIEI